MTLTELFTSIANAIRTKTGGTAAIKAEDFPSAIGEIVTPVLQEKTIKSNIINNTVTPDEGYNGLSKVTVTGIDVATQATPSISVDAAGLITASATQTAGYVAAGTKSATKQMTVQAAKTVTPSTSEQTAVEAGVYTTGAVKVAPVPTERKSVTANGTYTPTSGKWFSSVTVAIPTYDGGVS